MKKASRVKRCQENTGEGNHHASGYMEWNLMYHPRPRDHDRYLKAATEQTKLYGKIRPLSREFGGGFCGGSRRSYNISVKIFKILKIYIADGR